MNVSSAIIVELAELLTVSQQLKSINLMLGALMSSIADIKTAEDALAAKVTSLQGDVANVSAAIAAGNQSLKDQIKALQDQLAAAHAAAGDPAATQAAIDAAVAGLNTMGTTIDSVDAAVKAIGSAPAPAADPVPAPAPDTPAA